MSQAQAETDISALAAAPTEWRREVLAQWRASHPKGLLS
jgi:hypothetical protein